MFLELYISYTCNTVCPNPSPHDESECARERLWGFLGYVSRNTLSELATIIYDSDLTALRHYIDDNNPQTLTDRHGNNPLHLSVIFKKMDVFDYLISLENVDINALNSYGQSVMHFAVTSNDEYFITRLIEKGADVNFVDDSGFTPLYAASSRRYSSKIYEILLENGADINFQNPFDIGRTALNNACLCDNDEAIYILLCHGADACITDSEGMLPLTCIMYSEKENNTECHEVLFNYTFGRHKTTVNLRTLTIAMRINSPLFPELLKKVNHVQYSPDNLTELSKIIFFIREDYFRLFLEQFGYVVKEMLKHLKNPIDLYFKWWDCENADSNVIQFMHYMSMLFEFGPSYNFVEGSMKFTEIISHMVMLYKKGRLSMPVLKQMFYFFYSHGLPCTFRHIVVVYENCGFGEILKFLLDFETIQISSRFDESNAMMPRLLHDVHLTIDTFIEQEKRPHKRYRSVLKFFAAPKVRNFFADASDEDVEFQKKLDNLPKMPCLIELAREVARKHIIETFKIVKSRDFYRLVNRLPINEIYKKILTYEQELYRM